MRLFYRKIGEGPPLIILHGLFGSSDNWLTIAKKISTSFTVYLPDQRNHGLSPHDEIHNYDSMSNDLYELITELDLRKFFLAGHSMGGKTAMKFAMKWPEMIQGLMIADISPFGDEKNKAQAYNEYYEILKSIIDTDVSKAASRTDADKLLAERIPSGKVRSLILKNLQRDENKKFFWKLNAWALLNNLDKIVEGLPSTQQITGFPVIFLKGEYSEYLLKEDYNAITRLFPAAEIRVIKKAGHWFHSDNPEAASQALLDMLDT
ncbi:MAG: alpha/beta fold hydrolase [Bacteroidales bacterium]|nr:alpha/beta fold hydrolase [Bacteroidales bacterium]